MSKARHRAPMRATHKITAGMTALLALTLATPMALADMRGIDVSGWQSESITCTADYDFAVVKATQGTSFINRSWTRQSQCVHLRGKSLGLYHYAGGTDPRAEADFYLATVQAYVGRAMLVLDWEQIQNASWGDGSWVDAWVNRVHDRTGVWPVIYVQASAIGQLSDHVRKNCGLWVARYASVAVTGYHRPAWYGRYNEAMGQYTPNGRVAGSAEALDLNYFRGDENAWAKYANPTNPGAAAPVRPPVEQRPPTPAPAPAPSVDLNALADKVINGDFGNLPERRIRLGASYAAVQAIVNERLNRQATRPAASTVRVTVRRGDTMSAIAARTGLYPVSRWRVPSGNVSRIYPGQVVTYTRSGSAQASRPATSSTRVHTVKRGETLSGIFGADWQRVAQLNGLRNPNLIYPGQHLRY